MRAVEKKGRKWAAVGENGGRRENVRKEGQEKKCEDGGERRKCVVGGKMVEREGGRCEEDGEMWS